MISDFAQAHKVNLLVSFPTFQLWWSLAPFVDGLIQCFAAIPDKSLNASMTENEFELM